MDRMDHPPGFVIWLYGLPCSGKSTLAKALSDWARANSRPVLGLDGDELRAGICSDLGFSDADRTENVRRVSHLAKLASASGLLVIVSLVTPTAALRELARSVIPPERLLLIAVDCPLEECKRRDVKGMYAKAAAGLIKGLTGVDGIFEPALSGEFRVDTLNLNVDQCLGAMLAEATARGWN